MTGWTALSIWRPKDKAEGGPRVDEVPATVTVDDGGDFAVVLHITTTTGGLWTVAATLSLDEARRIGQELLDGAGEVNP